MSVKELIRQEIIRMHQEAVLASYGNDTDWLRSRIGTCVDILDFIDSLPEEKPSDELEDAAKEYATTHLRNNEFPTADSAFIAGAEWQKAKDAGQRARESSEQLPRYYGD